MTTTTMAPRRADSASDLRPASRWLAALILPIGPAAVAVLRFILPYQTNQSSAAAVRAVEAHQGTQNVVVWLGFVAYLTLVPAVMFAGRIVGRRSPRLAAVASVLLVLGYLSLAWLNVGDAMLLFGIHHDLPQSDLVSIYNGVHPAGDVAEGLFVIGHVVGTILLGVAMLRTRIVPVWAAVVTILAQPIHFTAAVIVGSHPLDLVGWGANAVGFAALSVAILRMSDDEWAPPPARRP